MTKPSFCGAARWRANCAGWRRWSATLLLLAGLAPAVAQPPEAAPAAPSTESPAGSPAMAEPPQVSLLTFAPGEVYWQRFAHNAILLRAADGRTAVFNYGIFDFHQHDFFLNFARGRMLYRLDTDTLGRTLSIYRDEHRWVWEQQLALSLDQRRALTDLLIANLAPDKVEYRYDYFADNCSTRVRDALDRVLGGALRTQLQVLPTDDSYRGEVMRLMSPEPLMMIGMHLGLGPRTDAPLNVWQHSFLPLTLMRAVRNVRLDDAGGARPLVASEGWMLPPRAAPDYGPQLPAGETEAHRLLLPFALAGFAFAGLLLALRAAQRVAAARVLLAVLATTGSFVAGLAGLVMIAGWTLTDHWGMWGNHNLLLCNPLLLATLPAWVGAARGSWYPSAFAAGLSKLVLLIAAAAPLSQFLPQAQDQLAWIALLLPPLAAMTSILHAAHRSPPIWSR